MSKAAWFVVAIALSGCGQDSVTPTLSPVVAEMPTVEVAKLDTQPTSLEEPRTFSMSCSIDSATTGEVTIKLQLIYRDGFVRPDAADFGVYLGHPDWQLEPDAVDSGFDLQDIPCLTPEMFQVRLILPDRELRPTVVSDPPCCWPSMSGFASGEFSYQFQSRGLPQAIDEIVVGFEGRRYSFRPQSTQHVQQTRCDPSYLIRALPTL